MITWLRERSCLFRLGVEEAGKEKIRTLIDEIWKRAGNLQLIVDPQLGNTVHKSPNRVCEDKSVNIPQTSFLSAKHDEVNELAVSTH